MRKIYRSFFIPFLFFAVFLQANPLWAVASAGFRSGTIYFSKDCDPKSKTSVSGGDVCATDPVLPSGTANYFDLLKQIFPDLRSDGTSSGATKVPRKYLGQMYLSEPEAASASGSSPKNFLPAGDFAYLTLGDRVVVLDRNSGWLAYFLVQPTPKLLDLVGIAQDQFVSFAIETGVYPLGQGNFLFWVGNSHHNAGESFNIYNLIHAGSDKVDIVYDGPFLYSFLLPSSSDCRVTQNLTPVRAGANDSAGFPRLAMRVQQEKVCEKGGRSIVSARRAFNADLSWDPTKQKYMGGSKELFQLNRCIVEDKPNCGA